MSYMDSENLVADNGGDVSIAHIPCGQPSLEFTAEFSCSDACYNSYCKKDLFNSSYQTQISNSTDASESLAKESVDITNLEYCEEESGVSEFDETGCLRQPRCRDDRQNLQLIRNTIDQSRPPTISMTTVTNCEPFSDLPDIMPSAYSDTEEAIPALYDPYETMDKADNYVLQASDEKGTGNTTQVVKEFVGPSVTIGSETSESKSVKTGNRSRGIAEYIVEEVEEQKSTTAPPCQYKHSPKGKRLRTSRKKPEPWFCVSRPISEQTKDIKICSVNRSTSIYFSRLLEKCRSIVEYCTQRGDGEEVNEHNIADLNYNYHWGDSIPSNAKGTTIRVVYQNVHRSVSASDNPHTTNLLDNLNNMEADIFMASESNVNWKSAANRNAFKTKVSRVWSANRLAFSTSDIGFQFEGHEFLPGGTCTMVVDSLSMRVVKVGEDESGLGRWSYVTLEGQGGRKVTFITAYRLCQGSMRGISTTCQQQRKVINEQEIKKGVTTSTPDTNYLRKKFTDDLLIFIQSLKEAGHAIVLGIDANETHTASITKEGIAKEGSISWLLEQAELSEVFETIHRVVPDSTTTTPGRFIDWVAVYGIPVHRVALMQANMPAKSDHLGIVVDLDLQFLFDNACSKLVQTQPRKLTSDNAAAVKKYVDFIKKQFTEHKIIERCQRLRQISELEEFTDEHRRQLYALDRQVTEILLGAENQCSNKRAHRNLWSPALQKAGKEIGYWRQRINSDGQISAGTKDLGVSIGLSAVLLQPMSIELCKFYSTVAWKSYRGIQSQARAYRESFLKERAKEVASRGNGDVAQAIRQIRHREKLKRDYAAIRRGYGVSKQGLATLDTPDEATGGRRLITKAEEIHAYLLQRNEKHYSQATFTTFGDAGPGFHYINPANPDSDKYIDEMLAGVFEPWPTASPNVREFLQELKCKITEEMSIKLSFEEFKQLFKTIPECTASSVSGLHYGHYRVLSKLADESIIKVLFDLVEIAFTTHSPLPRWRHATQLMLEKGKGPAIENLRIIQLLEADMNWLLRVLWGRRLDRHALKAGIYNEAQFASPGKLCQSAIVNKVLFFDLLRQTRQYGALMDNDATAAFDRVLPALCVVTCRQLGMPKSAQRFFFTLLRQMVYTTTTAHGRSDATYAANANPSVPGQGVIQGGGASLPNYKSQQLPVINAYETNCTPAVFRHASKTTAAFRRWVSGFSDDIGLFLNELGVRISGIDPDLPIAQRVRNVLQRNLEKYEEYFFTAGGALNLKKCFYYFVGFEWTGTEWRYKKNCEMQVEQIGVTRTTLDNSGSEQRVQWCEANDAQRTLGSHIAPDGSFHRQMEVSLGKLSDWKKCLREINSSNVNAKWLSFKTVFLKKIMYPLIGHSCRQDDLQAIQTSVDREVLHILGLNEHFPRAVLRAPLKYGGMGCVNIYGQHVIDKLIMFLHHVREKGQMYETMKTSMSLTQLECGSSMPFFTLPAMVWHPLVTQTWITHIWNACQPNNIEVKFHPAEFWVPKPVRERDICIMDVASQMYSGTQLKQINMCRISLQVTFLSDIASGDRKRILLGYFNGNNHEASGRRSRLNWPPVGVLPGSWWKLWQEFLVRWCGTSLRIAKPLGRWFEGAEMLTQCCFFMHGRRLIMQHKDAFYEFSPASISARTRFRPQVFPFRDLQLLKTASVVDITYKNENIYVVSQSPQLIIPERSAMEAQTLQDLYNNLSTELQRTIGNVTWPAFPAIIDIAQSIQDGTAIGVSDGSVRVNEARATHAWIIQAGNGSEISGSGPVDGFIEPRTIHRAELQGQTAIFLMISLIAKLTGIVGGTIVTFCDNQAVVRKLQRGWHIWRYRHTKGADGDLQAQLRHTIGNLQTNLEIQQQTHWVKGHQDEDGIAALPRQVALNIQADNDTKVAYELQRPWRTRSWIPVLKSEGCAVYIGSQKVTSNVHLTLSERWHEEEAKAYLFQRHKIDASLLPTIYWQSLRYALAKFSAHRRAVALKVIHRHLPTQEKLFSQGRVAMCSLCPRCLMSEETNSHVYCCPHQDSAKRRKADWMELWQTLQKARTATLLEHIWRFHMQPLLGIPLGDSIVDSLNLVDGELKELVKLAIHEQTQIGWDKLLVGIGSVTWKTIQELIDADNPKPPARSGTVWMNTAMHQFLKFSMRCWKQRNAIVHGHTKQEQQQKALQNVRNQIREIYSNPPSLAPQFPSIFAIPLDHRLKLSLQSAEHWISMIKHQAKVTQHNLQVLIGQHRPMQAHLRTMRREVRSQNREKEQPVSPRKAHRRAVQVAVKEMRARLYWWESGGDRPHSKTRKEVRRQVSRQQPKGKKCVLRSEGGLSGHFPLRIHPP